MLYANCYLSRIEKSGFSFDTHPWKFVRQSEHLYRFLGKTIRSSLLCPLCAFSLEIVLENQKRSQFNFYTFSLLLFLPFNYPIINLAIILVIQIKVESQVATYKYGKGCQQLFQCTNNQLLFFDFAVFYVFVADSLLFFVSFSCLSYFLTFD